MKKQSKFKLLTCLLPLTLAFATPAISQESEDTKSDYIYEQPTLAKLSQMYWRLNKFTPDQDWAIDNFMMINECQIYKDYYHNEFEWRKIRETGKDYLLKNINKFPLRFELIQPLSLGEYNFEKKGFHVFNDHIIREARIFQVFSGDMNKTICGNDRTIQGYPRALRVELSRPLTFDFVPMEEKAAEKLVLKKSKAFKQLSEVKQTKERLYQFRDAVMVMQVKLYAYKPEDIKTQHAYFVSNVLGVLEGIEVYSDRNREDLIYEESFRQKQTSSDYEQRMRDKFKERMEKKRAQNRETENNSTENVQSP